jgi:site-specific recombinase XerC
VSRRILYRAPTEYRPTRKDGEKRLLSWLFAWTYEGYAEALSHKIGIESELKTAAEAAARKGSKLYLPTLRECVDDYLADPDTQAMASLIDRKRHVKVLTDHCGNLLVNTVTHVELREVIRAEFARGLSYESLKRLKAAISKFFNWLLENDRLDSVGLLGKVAIPESAPHDKRPRTMLTDAEFWQLVDCAKVPLRYRALYIASRLVGGMWASDLHALRWSSIDTTGWQWCLVTRPKTDGKGDEPVRLELEVEAASVLREYYFAEGRPAPQKYVFGRERDRRDGEGDKGGRINSRGFSYAKRLRRHLKLAGVTRVELHKLPRGPRRLGWLSSRALPLIPAFVLHLACRRGGQHPDRHAARRSSTRGDRDEVRRSRQDHDGCAVSREAEARLSNGHRRGHRERLRDPIRTPRTHFVGGVLKTIQPPDQAVRRLFRGGPSQT